MRRVHKSKCSWPRLILISLYKQLAPHLKIRVHKSNTVCDFNTIWAVAAAIIVVSCPAPSLDEEGSGDTRGFSWD